MLMPVFLVDSRRNSASLLARQLRLRLVGEGSDIPRNCSNITVSIHAIATFQALHDYLRPRVSSQGIPGSRISGMLAAFAAAAGLPPGAGGRPPSSTTKLKCHQGQQQQHQYPCCCFIKLYIDRTCCRILNRWSHPRHAGF